MPKGWISGYDKRQYVSYYNAGPNENRAEFIYRRVLSYRTSLFALALNEWKANFRAGRSVYVTHNGATDRVKALYSMGAIDGYDLRQATRGHLLRPSAPTRCSGRKDVKASTHKTAPRAIGDSRSLRTSPLSKRRHRD